MPYAISFDFMIKQGHINYVSNNLHSLSTKDKKLTQTMKYPRVVGSYENLLGKYYTFQALAALRK